MIRKLKSKGYKKEGSTKKYYFYRFHDNNGDVYYSTTPVEEYGEYHFELEVTPGMLYMLSTNDESISNDFEGNTLEKIYDEVVLNQMFEGTFEKFIKWIQDSKVDMDSNEAMCIVDSNMDIIKYKGKYVCGDFDLMEHVPEMYE